MRKYGPKKETLSIPENSKVKLLFDRYKIPNDERRVIILINGHPHKELDTALNEGDVLSIFPPIGGG